MSNTRESNSRTATQRAGVGNKPRTRLDIDLTGLPAGMEPLWVREQTRGQYDHDNIDDALARGYTPATTEMLPNAGYQRSMPGRPVASDNLIRRNDLVLMYRPKESGAEERAEIKAFGEAQIASVKRVGSDANAQLDGENFYEASEVKDRIERTGPARPRQPKFPD